MLKPFAASFSLVMAGSFLIAGTAISGNLTERSPSEERGYRVAARECATCHAIDATGDSPRMDAPPLREVRRRYNGASLAREFETIGRVGHYQMPAKAISRSDREDLIAYIEIAQADTRRVGFVAG